MGTKRFLIIFICLSLYNIANAQIYVPKLKKYLNKFEYGDTNEISGIIEKADFDTARFHPFLRFSKKEAMIHYIGIVYVNDSVLVFVDKSGCSHSALGSLPPFVLRLNKLKKYEIYGSDSFYIKANGVSYTFILKANNKFIRVLREKLKAID